MRLLCLVDATTVTGLGRVARTLAVREAVLAAGHEVVVAGDIELPSARTLLEESGVEAHEGASTAVGVGRLAEAHDASWVLTDLASHPDGLSELLAARGVRVARFQDPADSRRPGGADLVIAPDWTPTPSVEIRPDGSRVVRGAAYAPVRAAAREAQERRHARAGGMGDRPRMLVLLGEGRMAEAMVAVAEWIANSDVAADVLCVGGDPAQRRQVEVQSTRRVRVLATAWRSDLPRLVADHDLVVLFGPRFVWEVACIGTPMALLAVRDGAAPALEAAAEAGAAIWLGRPGGQHSPAGRLRLALRDGMRRREVAAQASRLVDGAGAHRIVELLTQ